MTTAPNTVEVIDGNSNTLVASVPLGPAPRGGGLGNGAWGVGVNPATNRIYAASQSSNTVAVIDGATHTVVASIPVQRPWGVAVNPATHRVYAVSGNDLAVIDDAANALVTTIAIAAVPGFACLHGGSGETGLAVNPTTNRVYVGTLCAGPEAFLRRSGLVVVDGYSDTVVATIPLDHSRTPTGMAANSSTNRVYVAGGDGLVVVMDGASNAVVGTVPVGTGPTGGIVGVYAYTSRLAVNPAMNRVYMADQHGNSVAFIDGASHTVVARPAVGRRPRDLAINLATNRVYAASGVSNAVLAIDGASHSVAAVVPVGNPGALAVDPARNRVYATVSQTGRMVVIDGASNSVVATVVLESGIRPWCLGRGLAVNSDTNRIHVANACRGGISVIDGDTHSVVAHIPLGRSPPSLAVDEARNRLYAPTGSSLVVIDGATNTVATRVPLPPGSDPLDVAVNPAMHRVYVVDEATNTLVVVDAGSNAVMRVVGVGRGPRSVAVSPRTNRVYVANSEDNTVSVVDGVSHAVVATVSVGDRPLAVEVNPITGRVYVANEAGDSLSTIDEGTVPPSPTPTLPAIGGRGFGIRAQEWAVAMDWQPGREHAGYLIVRVALPTGRVTVLPPGGRLPAEATGYRDAEVLRESLYCYVLAPLGASGLPLGSSDLLCFFPQTSAGFAPAEVTLRLNESNLATFTWTAWGRPDGYLLVAIGADGHQRAVPFSRDATRAEHDTRGVATVYLLVAMSGGAPTGSADIFLAVPGLSNLSPRTTSGVGR